jgi:hypothetical protein
MAAPPVFAACLEPVAGRAGRDFERRGGDEAGEFWEAYTDEANRAIARAMQASPDGTVVLQSLGVEVRFGANAVSEKMPYPPPSNMIQVTLTNGATRVVRPNSRPQGTETLRTIIEAGGGSAKAGPPAATRLKKPCYVTRAGLLDTRRGRRKDPKCSGGMCCGTVRNVAKYAARLAPAEKALGDVGDTPGHWACAHGNLGALELLVANGADLTARTARLGRSVGQSGAVGWSLGWHKGRGDMLVFMAHNVAQFDFSILHYAAATGDTQMLTLLLDEGVPVDLAFPASTATDWDKVRKNALSPPFWELFLISNRPFCQDRLGTTIGPVEN